MARTPYLTDPETEIEEEEEEEEAPTEEESQEDESQTEEGTDETSSDTEEEDQTEYIPKKSHDVIRNKYKQAKEEREQLRQQLDEMQKQSRGDGEDQSQKLEETEKKAEQYRQKYENTLKETKLQELAAKYEAKDSDTVKKLVDLSEVEIDEDGTVDTTDLDEQLRSLQQEKPFLFGEEKARNIGNSSGNAPEGGTKETPWIKESELQANPDWMNKNIDMVNKAAKEGKIIRDL